MTASLAKDVRNAGKGRSRFVHPRTFTTHISGESNIYHDLWLMLVFSLVFQCDQSSPLCQRCFRAGRKCSGYRPRTELVFRDMTREAELKVIKHARKGPSVSLNAIPSTSRTPAREAQDKIQDELEAIYRSKVSNTSLVSPGWQELAVACFFDNYVVLSDVVDERLHFLPGLYKSSNLCDLLKEALHAVSFASKGNQLCLDWMITEGGLAYSRALLLFVRVSEHRATEDTTLAAIYLFGLYEVRFFPIVCSVHVQKARTNFQEQNISGQKSSGSLFTLHHHQGRSLLLRLRGDDQFHNQIQRSLFRTSHALIVSIPNVESPLQI
jgi:hypothetical protein